MPTTPESITELPTLAQGSVQGDDILPIVDVHDLTDPTGTTKGVTLDASTYRLIPSGGRTVANFKTYLANNAVFNVKDYGAVGDGVTDDTATIQAAITAAAAVSVAPAQGALVAFPPGDYLVSAQLTVPAMVSLRGAGTRSTRITSSYSGFAIKIGTTGGTLAYGCSIAALSCNMTNATGGAIQAIGTAGFVARDLYLEGLVSSTNTGIFLDGGAATNIFSVLDNVQCNHTKFGLHIGTSGAAVTTSVTALGFKVLTDKVAGDYGIKVDASCGNGSQFFGGNVEDCTTGIEIAGFGCQFFGVRFENNTTALLLDSGAKDNVFVGCFNWGAGTITNNSGNTKNVFLGCRNSADNSYPGDTLALASTLGDFTLSAADNLVVAANGTAARYIISDTGAGYTGKHVMQAGNGSAGAGGAVNLYGHTHATHPGDVVAGVSSGSGGKFRVNSQGLDGGTDWLTVGSTACSVAGSFQATTGFGCNGQAPQTAVAGGAALAAYGAGANGFDTAGHAQEIHDKLNTVLTALRANGILTT